MTLDMAIAVQDALEAIKGHVDMDAYVAMHKADSQESAREAYLKASDEIASCGTVRKALNSIQRVIDSLTSPSGQAAVIVTRPCMVCGRVKEMEPGYYTCKGCTTDSDRTENAGKVLITTGGYTHFVDKPVARRIRIETRIAKHAITSLLSQGYTLGVFDGEETTISRSKDVKAILDAMQTTDEDKLLVYRGDAHKYTRGSGQEPLCSVCNEEQGGLQHGTIGWVFFVYGNDGYDVINDYTTNLEDALKATNAFAESLDTV